jgi:outer membrane lipoprotein-sorting protein
MSRSIRVLLTGAAIAAFGFHAAASEPAPSSAAPANTPEVEKMLRAADAPHEAFAEGVIHLRISVEQGRGEPATSEVDLHLKGDDKSLAVIRTGKQQGRRILTTGKDVRLIVPGSSRAIPVSSNQRLMGAAAFGDLVGLRLADAFDATLRPAGETIGDTPCRVLDLKAKRSGAPNPSGTLWVGREDGLPRRLRLALSSGKDAKELRFARYATSGSGPRVERLEIRDLLGAKDVTVLEFTRYESKKLDDALFTPEGARALP